MKPQISVIIPVYNVEAFLKKCVDSVIKQEVRELEIILVDDGSTDNCPEMCDEIASRDSRVSVIHKSNEGLSSARNKGLDAATGTYISFVDSDDYILPHMYSRMYGFCEENSLDIGICAAYRCGSHDSPLNEFWAKGKTAVLKYPGAQLYDFMLTWNITGRNAAAWNKLYRREFIKDLRFKEGFISEDSLFNCTCFGGAKAVGAIDEAYYVYINRIDSLLGSCDAEKVRRHAHEYWNLLSGVTDGRERQNEILAYSAVRLLATVIYNLKLSRYNVEKYCKILCALINEMELEPHLLLAQEPGAFADYIKAFGISGGEAENYFNFICSLNQGYDAITARQSRYKNEFRQVRQ